MPFEHPWRQYLGGDFFYGFSGARARLITQLTNGRTTMDFAKAGTVAWLDQLLTATATADVPTLNRDFAKFCRSNTKYNEVVNGISDTEVAATDDDVANNRRWRRKSKAGIEFLVKHHHNIHFAVDAGMDWTAVISKPLAYTETATPFGAKPEFKASDEFKMRIITYAEIRFIYRNRTNDDFAKRIQFWYQGSANGMFSPGPTPWTKDATTWANYLPSAEDA